MLRLLQHCFFAVLLTLGFSTMTPDAQAQAPAQQYLHLELKDGTVVIELRPDLAPQTVARVSELAAKGFYDGLKFHRVIEGFMAQTGDPKGNGTGGSGKNIVAEFNSGTHQRGAVSMARAMDPNSADSQFFIVLADASFLDGQYTYFGQVISGMDYVDNIKKGDPNDNGSVSNPDKIVKLTLSNTFKLAPDAAGKKRSGHDGSL